MRTLNKILWSGVAGGGSNLTTATLDIRHISIVTLQAIWTGTLTGTFQVKGSCDPSTDDIGSGVINWDNVGGTSSLAPAGSAGRGVIELKDLGFAWLQLVWTLTSGTGNLTAIINGKGV